MSSVRASCQLADSAGAIATLSFERSLTLIWLSTLMNKHARVTIRYASRSRVRAMCVGLELERGVPEL